MPPISLRQSRNRLWYQRTRRPISQSRFVQSTCGEQILYNTNDSKQVPEGGIMKCLKAVLDAAALVGPADDSQIPVLYTHTCCPYAERVWLAALAAGVPHKLVQVDLSAKPSWFTGINPRGLVPCVAWQGSTRVESIDLCWWIWETWWKGPDGPDASNTVKRATAAANDFASACLALIAADTDIAWAVGTNAQSGVLRRFEKTMDRFEALLKQGGNPFFGGNVLSVADVVLWPFWERASWCAGELSGYRPEANCGPALTAWAKAMRREPCVQLVGPNPTFFLSAVHATGRLDWFDYETCVIQDSHPHLISS